MRTLIERYNKYKIVIFMLFIDFEKVFRFTWSILEFLNKCGVDSGNLTHSDMCTKTLLYIWSH